VAASPTFESWLVVERHRLAAEAEALDPADDQLGDPCWEGMAARGLGLLHATAGDHAAATAWLAEANTRCNRVTDPYQWVRAYVLDATATTALERHDEVEARRLVDLLASPAARGDMRELVVRPHLHRGRLGDPTALASARLLAAGIDNPALTRLLDGGPGQPSVVPDRGDGA
jgi:hypothetical protein